MRRLTLLLPVLLMTSCSVINLGINYPNCNPPTDKPPYSKCQSSPPQYVWQSFDGTRFPFIKALPKPPRKPRAVVILAIGLDATTGDYQYLTDYLVKRGYAVYASETRFQSYDPTWLRHGWVGDWHAWVNDLQAFTSQVHEWQPGLPIFYHGHSLGCLVSLQAVAPLVTPESGKTVAPMPPVRGLILQSPAIALMPDEESVGKKCFRVLIDWTRVPDMLLMHAAGAQLTGDPTWDCAWMSSPDRVHAGYTGHYINQACRMGHEALLTSRRLNLQKMPVLALEGQKDTIAGTATPDGSLDNYIRKDLRVTPRLYCEGRHLLEAGNVPENCHHLVKELAVRDIANWLDQHSP